MSSPGAAWAAPLDDLYRELDATPRGLTSAEAAARLQRVGPNTLAERRRSDLPALLLRTFTSPIVLILIAAALLSFALRDPTDATIIIGIVLVSGFLDIWQERSAANAVEKLLETVELRATVVRDGAEREVPVDEIAPGDVVVLSAGSGIPADARLLDSRDLFVDEAALTGESYPVDKEPGVLPADTALARRSNALFLGTHVVSGSARALVVRTGPRTELGQISGRLSSRTAPTEFERGVRRFGYLLMKITLVLVATIFAVNLYLQRPFLDSLLFALALAVGLTPQLLPAIISVNLARGAKGMAAKKAIVKRLAAIENFGSMDVLCSDKTGTLTEGQVRVRSAVDAAGSESERVLLHAFVNARFQAGFGNPIDRAIVEQENLSTDGWTRLDEAPYDFARKRLSVLVSHDGQALLITKGAVTSVLDVCSAAELGGNKPTPMPQARDRVRALYESLSKQGFRTLGVAIRELPAGTTTLRREDERDMTLLGLLVLHDPPKAGAAETVADLKRSGVSLKILTGDNALVAAQVAKAVGFEDARVMTGSDIRALGDDDLAGRASRTDVFAEVEPDQKERILLSLRRAGHVVGYLGDGINDAPALHAADVSISVQGAVDVAKEAADIVLLEQDLGVLRAGILEGRRTFANTLKYVFMATSANFGNMFSMAGASLFLPFLPLLPKQILVLNLLTDLPELTIATDRVDQAWIEEPHRWDVRFIRSFMLVFGPLSSLFDFLTFGVLLVLLRASPVEFRTGWFMESVVSAAMIVLVLRTRASLLHSRPSRALVLATALVAVSAVALPFTPLGGVLGFSRIPLTFVAIMFVVVLAYGVSAELAKRWFYPRVARATRTPARPAWHLRTHTRGAHSLR